MPDLTQAGFRALNRIVRPLVKAGVASPLPIGVGLVVVENTGRVSGMTREVPAVGLRVGRQVLVSTVRDDSQWIRNLEAEPTGAVWLCGRRRETTAIVSRGPLNVAVLQLNDD